MQSKAFRVLKSQATQQVSGYFLESWKQSYRFTSSWLLPATVALTLIPISAWAGPPRRTICGFNVPPGYVLIRYKYSDNCPGIGDNAVVVQPVLVAPAAPIVVPAVPAAVPNPVPPVTVQPPVAPAPVSVPAPVGTAPVPGPPPIQRPFPGPPPGYPPYGTPAYPPGYPAAPYPPPGF